jgi:hypothetical protein
MCKKSKKKNSINLIFHRRGGGGDPEEEQPGHSGQDQREERAEPPGPGRHLQVQAGHGV